MKCRRRPLITSLALTSWAGGGCTHLDAGIRSAGLTTLTQAHARSSCSYLTFLSDDFPTSVLETRLVAAGALFEDATAPGAVRVGGSGGAQQQQQRSMRQGGPQRTESDEDSDFD